MITDHALSPEKLDGGVQAVTKYLIEALVSLGEVELHTISFDYSLDQSRTVAGDGYTRHLLPGSSLGTLTLFRKDQRVLDRVLRRIRPSVVHGQGAGHHGILASRSPYPSVITIHGIMAEEAKFYVGRAKRARHWLLSKISEHYCIKQGRHTILISPYVSEYFEGRLAGTRYHIPNPVSDNFFRLQRRERPGRVLFAGRLMHLKGVMDLLQATSIVIQSQALEIILAGSLDDRPYVTRLQEEAERLGISSVVQFKGLLGESELREEFSQCSVLVLPSYQESAPMVIAEAMAAGVPVIASRVGGIPYQVREGETGYMIAPGDVPMLAERLVALLGDPALRESFGDSAKGFATEQYSGANVARRTIEVYRQLA